MKSFKRYIYKIGSIEDENNPPTVDDNSAEYINGIFNFNTSHFTNNFSDPDGDSYKNLRIRSLPRIGALKYNNNLVTKDFNFDLANINNLTYELPNNYMISSNGYCIFEDSIENIITQNEAEGYSLSYLGQGKLEFQKVIDFEVPDSTDVYAFINTNNSIEQGRETKAALQEWFTQYQSINPSFTGNLYIIPTSSERWVLYLSMIRHGVFNSIASGEWDEIKQLPPNYMIGNASTDIVNEDWQFNPNSIVLSFVDSANSVYHDDSLLGGFDGDIIQPSRAYKNDLSLHLRDSEAFSFFRGVSYPIVKDSYGNTASMVLHTMAAIEGTTLSEIDIQNLGTQVDVSILEEENPYETLTPLKELGWVGVYNKDTTAFDAGFSDELTSYVEGSATTQITTRTIEGECEEGGAICFNFSVSDDHPENILFSNIAEFCFIGTDNPDNIQEANAPTVDSVTRPYEPSMDIFSITDFTNNFQDLDGDSYETIRLHSRMQSSKGIILEGLLVQGSVPTIPHELNHTEADTVSFSLNGKDIVLQDRLLQYTDPLVSLINDKEVAGFSLLEVNGANFVFYKLNTSDPETPTVETIEGKDIGNSTISLSFRISDDSPYNLFSNLAKVNLELDNENTPPTVGDSSDVMDSSEYSFSASHFSTDFIDAEGDLPKSIKIESEIEATFGQMTFKGYNLSVPYAFDISEVADLKYTVDDRFVFDNGNIFSFEKSIAEYSSELASDGWTFASHQGGILTYERIFNQKLEYKYITGNTVETKEYCFTFKVSDDNGTPLFSNQATVCLEIPETETPIEINLPPIVGDNTIDL